MTDERRNLSTQASTILLLELRGGVLEHLGTLTLRQAVQMSNGSLTSVTHVDYYVYVNN